MTSLFVILNKKTGNSCWLIPNFNYLIITVWFNLDRDCSTLLLSAALYVICARAFSCRVIETVPSLSTDYMSVVQIFICFGFICKMLFINIRIFPFNSSNMLPVQYPVFIIVLNCYHLSPLMFGKKWVLIWSISEVFFINFIWFFAG